MTERFPFLGIISKDLTPGTYASNPETDDDGYWDGWIGVYGVGRTDNVVLYMEHLRDEDMGIQGDEIVQEQTGVHELPSSAPSTIGALGRARRLPGRRGARP